MDVLLEDLAAHGPGRLEEHLAGGPAAALGPPRRMLAEGGAPLAALVSVKERCKASTDAELTHRLRSLASYFTVVAVALDRHGERITSRPFAELEPILLDLAAATDEPWSGLFERALATGEDR